MDKQKKKAWEGATFDDHDDQKWSKDQALKPTSSTGSVNSSMKTATTMNSGRV